MNIFGDPPYEGPKVDISERFGDCFSCHKPLPPDHYVDEHYQGFCNDDCAQDFYESAHEQEQSDLRDGRTPTFAQKNAEAFALHAEVH